MTENLRLAFLPLLYPANQLYRSSGRFGIEIEIKIAIKVGVDPFDFDQGTAA
jgi:hypothetical protein